MLVFFHCPSNAGYAIARLERVFLALARRIAGDDSRIHFAYTSLSSGHPEALPATFNRVIQFDANDRDPVRLREIEDYVRRHGIELAFGFDQPVRGAGYRALRRGGVRRFISYWGAPMSSINHGVKLALKRLDVRLARNGPDHYIFESKAMQQTAVSGRGIPAAKTSVTYLGVDAELFRPQDAATHHAHQTFGIPSERRIVYYSGHMEERKGVHVLVKAVVDLVTRRGRRDVHLLILGNRAGEETPYASLYRGTPAESHVTFGGYRDDIPRILPSCDIGAIASTGWDSFTASSLEVAACGLPLLVSRLQGLTETIEEGKTGFSFPAGDHQALAGHIARLLDDPGQRAAMGHAARQRILDRFTADHQLASLIATVRRVAR